MLFPSNAVLRFLTTWRLIPRFSILVLLAIAGITGCMPHQTPKAETKVQFQYQAVSRVSPVKKPHVVYVFPPLLADSKGKPLEKMQPRRGADGGVIDWEPPSAASRTVRSALCRDLKKRGYHLVGYQDVLNMEISHSILIVSAFYSKPFTIESPKSNGPDTGVLTMIRAKTFELDLDPAKAVSISDLDGLTLYRSSEGFGSVVDASLSTLLGWLGDNAVGVQNISHFCPRKTVNQDKQQ